MVLMNKDCKLVNTTPESLDDTMTYETIKAIYDDARYLTAEAWISMCDANDARTEEEADKVYEEFLRKLHYLNRISVNARRG